MNHTEIGHRQTKYKKGGNAGVEGTSYQINILIILLLKGLKLEEEWRLSTENKEAGKFDDVVFESAEGGIFVQAKHKENTEKKITLDGLLSTNSKNDDFSLPKYFFSYVEIREKFKIKSLIIATNSDLKIDAEIKKYTTKQNLNEEDMLYYEGSESASLYVFNDSILEQLKENIEKYYEENLQRKNISKEVICNENITEFLEYLQFLTNYPVKGNLDAAVETVISETDLARNLDSKTAYNYMYRKIQDWFKQKKGVYLTKAYAKALICEIRTNSHCNALEKIDVHFDNHELPVKDPNKRVWHLVSEKDHIVDLMKFYRTLQKRNDKEFLLITPEHDEDTVNLMIEAFELPPYVYLIIACSENSGDFVTEEVCDKVSNALNSHDYKKLVLLSEEDNELVEYYRETNLYQSVEEEVKFSDLDEETQKKLIKRKNVVFQGKDTTLAELLTLSGTEWNELIDSEMLIKFFRNEKIMVGSKVEALSENIKQYYINRTFNSTTESFPEKRLCELDKIDKITLVSDSPGMGKSTVFTHLANALKEKYPNLWVTKVDINSYTKILSEFREAKVDVISITQLLNSEEETRIKTTFEDKLFSHPGKVLLIIDGIDEIAPYYTKLVSKLILDCKIKENIIKIYTSSRPHLRQELEKKLKVKALSLTPFTKDNQLEFLKKYWKKHLNLKKIAQLKKCEVYARHLISKIFEWIHDVEKTTLAEVPLQTRILAEVFQERSNLNGEELGEWEGCHEFLTSGGEEPKLPRKINLVKLYQMFMAKKRYIFVYDKSRLTGNVITSDAVNQAYEECKAFHQLLAMELLLGENAHMMTTYKTLREKNPDEKNVVKMGVVEKVGDRYSFMHRTFAEFYVAECLFFELNLKDQNGAFQNLFTDIILTGSQFNMIRSFLEGFFQDAFDSLPEQTVKSFSSLDYDRKLYHTDLDCTFMHVLVKEGHMNLIDFFFKCFGLMEKRVEIERIRDDIDKTLLHYAAQGHPKIVRLLVEKGADVYSEDCYGNMPLLDAVSEGQLEIARFLLKRGANFNVLNVHGKYEYTALHRAAEMGNHEIMELLLEHGADIGIKVNYGRTALHAACDLGDLDSVRLLVSNGADVRSKTDYGSTPLHVACQRAPKAVVEFLVDNGADVNEADNDGRTPLHVVAEFGDVGLLQYLEQNGADAQARDKNGCSPLHYAIRPDGLAVLAYLLETHDANLVDRSGNAALHKAVEMGYLDVIKLLVSRGADVNLKNTRGRTAFHEATHRGRLDIFQYLIEKGAEINVKDADGRTALHNEGLYLELAEFLVNNGADVNEADNRGRTSLHIAAEWGGVELFKYLEQKSADAKATDENGRSPLQYAIRPGGLDILDYILETNDIDQVDRSGNAALHLAVEKGYLDVVKLIVSRGADVNLKNSEGRTVLLIATHLHSQDVIQDTNQNWAEVNSTDAQDPTPFDNERLHLELVELLVDAGADVRLGDKHGRTPLHYAIVRDHTQLVQYLIGKGADANIPDECGRRPIHEAAEMRNFTVLELLVDAKCDVNAKDDRGRTALHVASRGSLDLVKFLVDNGAVVDVEDDEGCTPLQDCVATGELAVIEFLIGKGANVNIRNAEGCTPLLSAALEGNHDGIRLLVENGADVNARDNAGRTPFIVAVRCGHLATVKLMVERGANIHATDEGGSTDLHAAARWNFVDIVRFLVDSGADVDAADGNGRTALHVAARPKHLEVVKLLVERGAHVNATDHKDRTPLHATAARRCRDEDEYASLLEVTEFLVQSGAEVDARDIDGRTAMDFAAESGRTDKVALLVTLGGDIGVRDNSNTIPSECAAEGGSSDVVKFFEARKT